MPIQGTGENIGRKMYYEMTRACTARIVANVISSCVIKEGQPFASRNSSSRLLTGDILHRMILSLILHELFFFMYANILITAYRKA